MFIRRSKTVVTLILLLCLCACSKSPSPTTEIAVEDKFDDTIPSIVLENIGPDVSETLMSIDSVLSTLDIPTPYTVFNNQFGGESQVVVFDLLDSNNLLVHVTVRNSMENGCVVNYTYDTPEEAKEQITSMLQKMLGDSVDVRIEDEYYDYVVAYAQGKEYRWKDGHLERVP